MTTKTILVSQNYFTNDKIHFLRKLRIKWDNFFLNLGQKKKTNNVSRYTLQRNVKCT